jgi:anti-sigma regulatory factor (Ser/Thr protein kinase)
MVKVRSRGEDIRMYIVDNVEKHPETLARLTAEHFGITRQAVNKHLQRLVEEKLLSESGKTRNRSYRLSPLVEWRERYKTGPGSAEDVIWTKDARLALGQLPDNAMNIWHHGFTEMFNNALDHSDGDTISVWIKKTAASAQMCVSDNGIGIFKKIQAALNLPDERHSVLELAKGKFTTDPKNHTGEGIFFTSRMFDSFAIVSGDVVFRHDYGTPIDIIRETDTSHSGTFVFMTLNNHTSRTTKKIFDQFTSDDDFTFSRSVVPVKLAKYGDDNLISRSQAKRLLARIELFKVVIFDFKEVPTIGRAFADEIFRVFANEHPHIAIHVANANSEIKRTLARFKPSAEPQATTRS